MPWTVRKRRGVRPWKIVRSDTGEVVGSSTSEAKAKASVAARYANTPGWEYETIDHATRAARRAKRNR